MSARYGGDEYFRCTKMPDGHWVACDNYENGIGDNIALVREIEPHRGFADAVYQLTGGPSVLPKRVDHQPKELVRTPPKVPTQHVEHQALGRSYLEERGISLETIEHAENTGFLRYSRDAVLYVGYDANSVAQNITRRDIRPDVEVPKKDFSGSLKSFPQILPGSNELWIVEGGADALATQDWYKQDGLEPPTVIVSGGSGVRNFLDTPEIIEMVKGATAVRVACENDKDEKTQDDSDRGHKLQLDRIREIRGGREGTSLYRPTGKDHAAGLRDGIKDMVDVNRVSREFKERARIEQEREERARIEQERIARRKERDNERRWPKR